MSPRDYTRESDALPPDEQPARGSRGGRPRTRKRGEFWTCRDAEKTSMRVVSLRQAATNAEALKAVLTATTDGHRMGGLANRVIGCRVCDAAHDVENSLKTLLAVLDEARTREDFV